MKPRLVVLLGILSVVTTAFLFHVWIAPKFRAAESVRRGVNATLVKPEADSSISPFGPESLTSLVVLRERVASQYRLQPDRRLIGAFDAMSRIVAGRPAPASAEWNGRSWTILAGGDTVGVLPDLAGFGDADALLTDWTRRLIARTGFRLGAGGRVSRAIVEDLRGWQAVSALRRLDAAWAAGTRDQAHLVAASEASARLAVETVDRVGAGDVVASHAFAVVALTCELGLPQAERDRILLAHALGYSDWALRRAGALPAGDPVRLYVTRDELGLSRFARESSGLEAAFLELLRVSARSLRGQRQEWLDLHLASWNAPRLPVLATGLQLRDADGVVIAAGQVVEAFTTELAPRGFRATAKTRSSLGPLLDEFERVESVPDSSLRGPFLPQTVLAAHERALLYSALERLGTQRLDNGSAAVRFAAGLRPREAGGPGAEFHRWYSLLADAAAGSADPDAMIAQLDTLSRLGGFLPGLTWSSLMGALPAGDVRHRRVARILARGADARPMNRVILGYLFREFLQAPTLGEPLYASGASCLAREYPEFGAVAAARANDSSTLAAILSGTDFAAEDWSEVLDDLRGIASVDTTVLRAAFERAITRHPNHWKSYDAYLHWLEDRGDYDGMRAVAERYLASPGTADTWFDVCFAKTAVARSYGYEKHWKEGIKAIDGYDSTYQFGAMQRMSLLLQGAGRSEEALDMARRAQANYPNLLFARIVLAEILWAQGAYDEAARALKESRTSITMADWKQDIAPAFVRVFQGRPGAEAVKAAEALFTARFVVGANVGQVAQAMALAGHDSTAFEIHSRIPTGGGEQVRNLVFAYGALERWRGTDKALEWAHQRLRPERREYALNMAFEQECDELIWRLELPELEPLSQDYLWLLRAAAVVRAHDHGERRQAVLAHLDSTSGSHYLDFARYLLDRTPEPQVLAVAADTKKRCELFFFAGLKAEAEGRVLDACDWYNMNRETGAYRNGESYWASGRLNAILSRGQPIVNADSRVAAAAN